MQTLFDQSVHHEIIARIDALTPDSRPKWGQMDVAQMVKHCQMPLLVAMGKMELSEDVNFFRRIMFRLYKPIMYNDKRWPENIPTPKAFKITEKVTFENERDQLKTIVHDFNSKAFNMRWPEHPYFGNFKTDQWGRMQYKHLDHHLRQFGV